MEESLSHDDIDAAFGQGTQRWEAMCDVYDDALERWIDGLLLVGFPPGLRQQAPRVDDPGIQPSPGAVERIAWRRTQRLPVTD